MVTKILFVVCVLWVSMQDAAPPSGSLFMDVYPGDITPSLTPSMTVNCSFSFETATDIADLISLIIAKENSQKQFEDLVSLNIFSPNKLKTAALLNGTSAVSGCIEGDGQSYLAIHWSFPTASEGGVYRCEVNGVDSTGHPTQKSQTMVVTSQSASFEELITKVSDLQRQQDRQETLNQNQSQTIDTLLSLTQTQSNMISEQSKMISALSVTVSNNTNTVTYMEKKLILQNLFIAHSPFYHSAEYNSHYYLVSKRELRDSKISEQTCEYYGGYLVEINNSDENEFVKGFLDSLDGFTHVLISGTDEGHSGQWTYTYSGGQLTYTDWYGNEPDTAKHSCIHMYRGSGWQWYDYPCIHNFTGNNSHVCEVNIN